MFAQGGYHSVGHHGRVNHEASLMDRLHHSLYPRGVHHADRVERFFYPRQHSGHSAQLDPVCRGRYEGLGCDWPPAGGVASLGSFDRTTAINFHNM